MWLARRSRGSEARSRARIGIVEATHVEHVGHGRWTGVVVVPTGENEQQAT